MRSSLLILAGSCSLALAASAEPIDLAGPWSVRLDGAEPTRIELPGTTDLAGLGEPAADLNPGYLTRPHRFVGQATYERDIDIPAAWNGQHVDLFLERVLWESSVSIDGRACGSADSLGTPHIHDLGELAPGRHRLTIRVDNRMIHPIGDRGHCYTEFTQSIWNGIVGRIELRPRPDVSLGLVRVFPAEDRKSIRVEAEIRAARTGQTVLQADCKELLGAAEAAFSFGPTGKFVSLTLPVVAKAKVWDEFSPRTYALRVRVAGQTVQISFGFRTFARDGHRLLINGRPSFMRGNMDCAQYPRTGHPPMDVESWRKILRVYQSYGFNQIRFHSWCPPEAAFTAADELGLYLQPEVLWIDGWMGGPNPRKDMDTPGHPKGVGKGDRTIDAYVRAEMRRMLDTYGNHPSFCFFAIGNELGSSDFKVMAEWIREEKERDPRRLYSASTARTITPFDDFADTHNIPGIGGTVNHLGVPHTDWDYEASYGRAPVPVLAHESGQMPVHPDWREIAKYTGPLKATGLELFRAAARSNGVEEQSADFQRASAHLQTILYKGEMEALLRSPGCSGISWLSMQDFPGQGEALVGWLDTFLEDKGVVTPAAFRRYSTTTVPLARFAKFVWTTNETFAATVQLAHWGAAALSNAVVTWQLGEAAGRFAATNCPVGSVTSLGSITVPLASMRAPDKVTLTVKVDGTDFENAWDVWVFPEAPPVPEPAGVVVTDRPADAWKAAEAGGRAILLAHKSGSAKLAAWMPLFWSARFFPGQNRDTLGALVQAGHPALAQFPTGEALDWQWHQVCDGARGFVLDELPAEYRPIVQPISDFHFNHKLGSVFEFVTTNGGRLLVCGYDLVSKLDQRPAARQLRASLFAYAAGSAFAPRTAIDRATFERLCPIPQDAPVAKVPAKFEQALLYVKAGMHHPGSGDVKWSRSIDEVRAADGFGYKVDCNAVWKDGRGTAWWGSPALRVEIACPRPDLYDLYVHLHDWNDNGRTGELVFEGRRYDLGPHAGEGLWVRLDVLREDALDNKLMLEARPKSGPNLQITAIALMPKTP